MKNSKLKLTIRQSDDRDSILLRVKSLEIRLIFFVSLRRLVRNSEREILNISRPPGSPDGQKQPPVYPSHPHRSSHSCLARARASQQPHTTPTWLRPLPSRALSTASRSPPSPRRRRPMSSRRRCVARAGTRQPFPRRRGIRRISSTADTSRRRHLRLCDGSLNARLAAAADARGLRRFV